MSDLPYFTGPEIKAIRQGLGRIRIETQPDSGRMTQTQFGRIICGVTWVTVSNWERGKQRPLAPARRRLLRQWEIIQAHDEREQETGKIESIFF